jgi:hypothetical protein
MRIGAEMTNLQIVMTPVSVVPSEVVGGHGVRDCGGGGTIRSDFKCPYASGRRIR